MLKKLSIFTVILLALFSSKTQAMGLFRPFAAKTGNIAHTAGTIRIHQTLAGVDTTQQQEKTHLKSKLNDVFTTIAGFYLFNKNYASCPLEGKQLAETLQLFRPLVKNPFKRQ